MNLRYLQYPHICWLIMVIQIDINGLLSGKIATGDMFFIFSPLESRETPSILPSYHLKPIH